MKYDQLDVAVQAAQASIRRMANDARIRLKLRPVEYPPVPLGGVVHE